jgi:hypothetical protein
MLKMDHANLHEKLSTALSVLLSDDHKTVVKKAAAELLKALA